MHFFHPTRLFGPTHLQNLLKITTLLFYLALLVCITFCFKIKLILMHFHLTSDKTCRVQMGLTKTTETIICCLIVRWWIPIWSNKKVTYKDLYQVQETLKLFFLTYIQLCVPTPNFRMFKVLSDGSTWFKDIHFNFYLMILHEKCLNC